ncbi:MAG: helix-turn-helix domain-containing protein [archaeon]|nr:helix-turn-helix domain-containing protein [archaeon]
MDEVIMNVDETADFLRCSKAWLYAHVQKGKDIPHHKLGGKTVFFKSELVEWLKTK